MAAGLAALAIAGCASAPRGSDGPPASRLELPADRDGLGTSIPPDLARTPDAEPRVEPLKPGGANKPYQVLGRDYVPIVRDAPFQQRGLASWYGRKFHGRRTASGEVYDMYAMTAAHPTLPIPSYARIRNPANGREVLVRINDRGPFHADRIVDLSYAAALKLDLLRGVAPVELERLTFDDIRAGNWRTGGAVIVAAARVPPLAFVTPAPGTSVAADKAPPLVFVAALAEPVAQAVSEPWPAAEAGAVAGAVAAAVAVEELAPMRSFTAPARGYWIQLGAFRERLGAELLQRRAAAEIEPLGPLLATFAEAALFRVQAGPYPSRDEARGAAERIRDALGLVPMILERR